MLTYFWGGDSLENLERKWVHPGGKASGRAYARRRFAWHFRPLLVLAEWNTSEIFRLFPFSDNPASFMPPGRPLAKPTRCRA